MDEYEVDLRDYLRVLWKGKWIVLITFLVAVGTALALSYSAPKQYRTETSLLILPPLAQEVNGEVGGTVFSPETYKRLALSNDLLQEVIHALPKRGRAEHKLVTFVITNRHRANDRQELSREIPLVSPRHLHRDRPGEDKSLC